MAVFKSKDVTVADGDAEDVRGQILQSLLTVADGDDIHDPFLAPSLRWDLIEESGLSEQVAELGAKDAGEGFFRQEEVGFGRSPCMKVRTQPAPGNEVVYMGVVAKVTSPGLQDADHAEGAADVLGVGSEFLKGLLGSFEEEVVEGFLIAPDEVPRGCRQSESGHEVGDGQEEFPLLIDPAVDLVVLALGAVAVLTGVVLEVVFVALRAVVQMTA